MFYDVIMSCVCVPCFSSGLHVHVLRNSNSSLKIYSAHLKCHRSVFEFSSRGSWFSVEFYAKLLVVVDPCPKGNSLMVLDDFCATTGTDRDGYESCVGYRRFRIAASWLQRPDLHRWPWCSNSGGARKEIYRTHGRSLETCPDMQCFSKRRVCQDRSRSSRGCLENKDQVP